MDTETTVTLMTTELGRVRTSALCRAFGWQVEVDGLVAYVLLRPRQHREQAFLLRASFDDFPWRAPSFAFVDRTTYQPHDTAWPPGVRHGSQPPGICTPGTREFHEHYHLNDAQYRWEPERYPFLQTLGRSTGGWSKG